jgi:hypothetical protein
MPVVKLILKHNVKKKGLRVNNVDAPSTIGWNLNPNGSVPLAVLGQHFEVERLWSIPNFLFTPGTSVWLL